MATEHRIRPAAPRDLVAETTTGTTTMKAIVQDSYGEAQDVLRHEEIERPVIGDGEVLLRVHAAGVDRVSGI